MMYASVAGLTLVCAVVYALFGTEPIRSGGNGKEWPCDSVESEVEDRDVAGTIALAETLDPLPAIAILERAHTTRSPPSLWDALGDAYSRAMQPAEALRYAAFGRVRRVNTRLAGAIARRCEAGLGGARTCSPLKYDCI
jgi:hypothetical protein